MPLESDNGIRHLKLLQSMREELSKPKGKLVEGTIEETIPKLKEKLLPKSNYLIGVGDVTAEVLVNNGFEPDIVITDGKTKRSHLDKELKFPSYDVLEAVSPAAEITIDAWQKIQIAVGNLPNKKSHIKIHGEEDLLVLPLMVETPDGTKIVYGQPDEGAVIRTVTPKTRRNANKILSQMKEIS